MTHGPLSDTIEDQHGGMSQTGLTAARVRPDPDASALKAG
jgi:hypothetical protein